MKTPLLPSTEIVSKPSTNETLPKGSVWVSKPDSNKPNPKRKYAPVSKLGEFMTLS